MKFCCNGGLIIGTLDGANIGLLVFYSLLIKLEIRDEIGHQNMFIFGTVAEDVATKRLEFFLNDFNSFSAHPPTTLDPRLEKVFELIRAGTFGPKELFEPIVQTVIKSDYYILAHDFPSCT